MLKSLMPPSHRHMQKLVFKIEQTEVYNMWLVVVGHIQVHGLNFSENYSQIVHEIMFGILYRTVIHFGLSAKIVNIETTFLYRGLEKEIYIQCSKG